MQIKRYDREHTIDVRIYPDGVVDADVDVGIGGLLIVKPRWRWNVDEAGNRTRAKAIIPSTSIVSADAADLREYIALLQVALGQMEKLDAEENNER